MTDKISEISTSNSTASEVIGEGTITKEEDRSSILEQAFAVCAINNKKVSAKVIGLADESKNTLLASHLFNENKLFHEIERTTKKQLDHALAPLNMDDGWELFSTIGEMKMYRIDKIDDDGIACDPVKGYHLLQGVSALEYTDIFFDPSLKKEWDVTIVNTNVVQQLHEHTIIIHQLHKRIWPTAQRESLFWSQFVDVSEYREPNAIDAFMVCNCSTERDDVKLPSSNVRAIIKVGMFCQTFLVNGDDPEKVDKSNLTRDNIYCKITYVAKIHPGGWVPTLGVRQIVKREFPKFLTEFTKYVEEKAKKNPLKISRDIC